MRHANDTLLLAKEGDIKYIFHMFSTFHKNLKFVTNRFEENSVHFLDITIDKTDTDLYYKTLICITNLRMRGNTLILTVVYLGIMKTRG